MATFDTPLEMQQGRDVKAAEKGNPQTQDLTGSYDDQELLDLWKVIQPECFDSRWIFLRQWQRNLWYVLGRQWIEYQSKYGGWRDKRMAAWIPRPVTNKCKETVQAIRAMFTSINLSVNVRPTGSEPENVAAASTADQMSPILHETHLMNQAMSEFDFWLLVTGNAFLHTFVDYDIKNGLLKIEYEQCTGCGVIASSNDLTGAQPICKGCGSSQFTQAMDKNGYPLVEQKLKGVPSTIVLSPLEISFPHTYTRFDDLPYVVRSRWRTKRYFESHPTLKDLVSKIVWAKAPQDHSLSLYTSLVQTNDLGITPIYWSEGSGRGGANDEGVAEYEVWMKPTVQYPDGLVFRIVGDSDPIVLHLEDEILPGPLPYRDVNGNALFTFTHASFEHVGGRILGSGPLDVIIQKQDQLNQLDSQVLLCLTRMGNPVWLEPKGSEIQKLTGMPGLVIKWNPLTVGGNAKPERIPGVPIDTSVMSLREQYLRDIEELAGTFDILKGQKPAGVEAFSAIQALIERSQARFSTVFKSRGEAYKNWFKFAIELEREFGPDERTKAVLTPARSWTFQTFKRAQLQGSFTIIVEDGATTPKTNLGMRAAVEHANSLGMLNMQDPDQQYEGLKLFGLTRMVPTLDIHVQRALQKQEAFEKWVVDQQAVQQFVVSAAKKEVEQQAQMQQMAESAAAGGVVTAPPAPPSMLEGSPLEWYPWYRAQIHLQEFLKWANGDRCGELMKTVPIVKQLLKIHQQEIEMAMPPLIMPTPGGPQPQGAGMAMHNSHQNSAPAGNTPQKPNPSGGSPQ